MFIHNHGCSMNNLINRFILLLIFVSVANAQNEIPRDTSFSTASSIKKEMEKYPFIKTVLSTITDDILVYKDVVYESFGSRKLHLDLFEPKIKSGKLPIVLIIHGGGWRTGDKKMEWPTAINLAQKGFIAATIEYRLSPEAKYPAAIHDLKSAVRWIRANHEQLGVNPNKIIVSGVSAGGELAAFLGATGDMKKFEGTGSNLKVSSKVNAVVDIDGILDFTHPAESNKDVDPEKPSAGKAWFGVSYAEDPSLWIEASPINYISQNMPPILFINSSHDRYHAGRDYAIEKMNSYGIYSEVRTIKDTPHTFWLFHPWFEETMKYLSDFVNNIDSQ